MLRRLAPLAAVAVAALLPAAGHAQPADPSARSCDWPMFGHSPQRTFASECAQAPTPATVATLHPRWVVHASDVVTAQPAVSDGTVYVGDWDGTFYALDQATGAVRWQTVLGSAAPAAWRDAHQGSYGAITSSAAVATVAGERTVFVGGGGSLYALDAATGAYLWRFDVDPQHPSGLGEVESSPVVWPGAPGGHPWVLFGADANQSSGFTGEGLWAVDAVAHTLAWHFNPEAYAGHALYGCGNVWSSPALDLQPQDPDPSRRAMVFFGTADCPDNGTVACPQDGSDPHCTPGATYDYSRRWQPYAEALIGLDAATGQPLWSYQAHTPYSTDDDDYGSSAQVFTLPGPHGGHRVVGEGNKDGSYQVLDRDTGALVWRAVEQGNGNVQPSQAIGGFIGNTAVGAGRVFGSAAIDTPFTYDPATGQPVPQDDPTAVATPMRGFSAADGTPAWQAVQGPSYGASSYAGGVVYNGALDGLLRAYDAATGRLLWAFPLGAPISSGAAVAGSDVVIGAGTSDTGLDMRACDALAGTPLAGPCAASPANPQLNPLAHTGEIWDFTTAAVPGSGGPLSGSGPYATAPSASAASQAPDARGGAGVRIVPERQGPPAEGPTRVAPALPISARVRAPVAPVAALAAVVALSIGTVALRRRRRAVSRRRNT